MRILFLEIIRLIRTKSIFITMLMAVVLSALLSIASVMMEKSSLVSNDGEILHLFGLEAVEHKRKIEKPLEGPVLSSVFSEVLSNYQELAAQFEGDIPDEIFIEKISPTTEMLFLIPLIFMDSEGNVSSSTLRELDPRKASDFYKEREKIQKFFWKRELNGDDFLIKQLNNREASVKKPFHFSSFSGWDTVGEYLGLCITLVVFLCILISSPVFSVEYQTGGDDILRTTKFGRKHLAISKLLATCLIVSFLYLFCMIVYFAVSLLLLGGEGLNTSVQFVNILSPSPYTIGDLFLRTIIIGFLVTLTLTLFTLFLSTILEKPILIMAFSSFILIIPIFFSLTITKSSFFNWIRYFFPPSMVEIYHNLLLVSYVRIASISIWYPVMVCISLVVYIVFLFFLSIRTYCNHEMRN